MLPPKDGLMAGRGRYIARKGKVWVTSHLLFSRTWQVEEALYMRQMRIFEFGWIFQSVPQ
jgi:hypothetical protein